MEAEIGWEKKKKKGGGGGGGEEIPLQKLRRWLSYLLGVGKKLSEAFAVLFRSLGSQIQDGRCLKINFTPSVRLARLKCELTDQDSTGGINFIVFDVKGS